MYKGQRRSTAYLVSRKSIYCFPSTSRILLTVHFIFKGKKWVFINSPDIPEISSDFTSVTPMYWWNSFIVFVLLGTHPLLLGGQRRCGFNAWPRLCWHMTNAAGIENHKHWSQVQCLNHSAMLSTVPLTRFSYLWHLQGNRVVNFRTIYRVLFIPYWPNWLTGLELLQTVR